MADAQAKLQALSEEYQKLQQDLQSAVQSRQKLEAQRQENQGVQKVAVSFPFFFFFFIPLVYIPGSTVLFQSPSSILTDDDVGI